MTHQTQLNHELQRAHAIYCCYWSIIVQTVQCTTRWYHIAPFAQFMILFRYLKLKNTHVQTKTGMQSLFILFIDFSFRFAVWFAFCVCVSVLKINNSPYPIQFTCACIWCHTFLVQYEFDFIGSKTFKFCSPRVFVCVRYVWVRLILRWRRMFWYQDQQLISHLSTGENFNISFWICHRSFPHHRCT